MFCFVLREGHKTNSFMENPKKPRKRIWGPIRYFIFLYFIITFYETKFNYASKNTGVVLVRWVNFFLTSFRKWQASPCCYAEFYNSSNCHRVFFIENNQWSWQTERGGYSGIFWCILTAHFRVAVPVTFWSLIFFQPGPKGKF